MARTRIAGRRPPRKPLCPAPTTRQLKNAVVAWIDFYKLDESYSELIVRKQLLQDDGIYAHQWSDEWKRMMRVELAKPCMLSDMLPEELINSIVDMANIGSNTPIKRVID